MMADFPETVLAPRLYADVPCTVCGCVCDDLQVTVADDQISSVAGACSLAEPWFSSLTEKLRAPICPAQIEGCPATTEQAVERSARILSASRAPLIWGLARSSTPGQRAAVRLAERLGATVDTTASVCHGPSIMAIQQVGESTCTLGEVRHRADLVIFWGADPMTSHPRHLERYSLEPRGQFVPQGRSDRRLVVIDGQPTATSELADLFLQVPERENFELIWALRYRLKQSWAKNAAHSPLKPEWERLFQLLTSCRYGVVFFGLGLAQQGSGHANVEALLRLVAELNACTRFTARRLRIPGDVSGADAVLCWQTGFPFGVNLSRGFPRYNPGEYTANELLERNEVDACLLVGSEPVKDLSPRAREALRRMPTISLDYPHVEPPFSPTVRFNTAVYGLHRPGTVYRMDEVPIPLRGFLATDLPSDEDVLQAIAHRLG